MNLFDLEQAVCLLLSASLETLLHINAKQCSLHASQATILEHKCKTSSRITMSKDRQHALLHHIYCMVDMQEFYIMFLKEMLKLYQSYQSIEHNDKDRKLYQVHENNSTRLVSHLKTPFVI
jgi:hypothetical protein